MKTGEGNAAFRDQDEPLQAAVKPLLVRKHSPEKDGRVKCSLTLA